MSNMFYKCSSLTSWNISNFNTNNVIKMNDMLHKLELIKIISNDY